MPTFVRVKDRATGHEYDVDARTLAARKLTRVKRARYPDLSGDGARPRPAKHNTTKAGVPVAITEGVSLNG